LTAVTETVLDEASKIDARPLPEAAYLLATAQLAASQSVLDCTDSICSAASTMASTINSGGVLYYTAAGSSALMAAADAMELGGTFSIAPEQIRILMAGGIPTDARMAGNTEDITTSLPQQLAEMHPQDTMIAVSASGNTAYTVTAATSAKGLGANVVAIANNKPSRLLAIADHPIYLATPPEILAGSTRMGAGTAQKITLNMLSTLMAIQLGHVHDGLMVNLHADNGKLRSRARHIVSLAAGVSENRAANALDAADNRVKLAVLLAAGAESIDSAEVLLNDANGRLRDALTRLDT